MEVALEARKAGLIDDAKQLLDASHKHGHVLLFDQIVGADHWSIKGIGTPQPNGARAVRFISRENKRKIKKISWLFDDQMTGRPFWANDLWKQTKAVLVLLELSVGPRLAQVVIPVDRHCCEWW